jgi:DNA modification methylase
MEIQRTSPGRVRDALVHVMSQASGPLSIKDLEIRVNMILGPTPSSSIRSYLRLNTPALFRRLERGVYGLRENTFADGPQEPVRGNVTSPIFSFGRATLFHADCLQWVQTQPPNSIHAIVTDPPYGLHEYTDEQQQKLKDKKGGVWRIPPSLGGYRRSPLPRFTTLTREQLVELRDYFGVWASLFLPKLVPGAHVVMASNPLVSYIVSNALADAGLERRGEIARLTTTLRGGDRPKNAHEEFAEVTVMPRSRWEPWIVFRKPLDGRVQDNLRKWKTGGFRRISANKPFADVIVSAPTKAHEKQLAPHLSLKPQSFLRKLVRAVLPLGEGVVVDPFAGSGSTLAAAEFLGYESVGVENNPEFFEIARQAIPKLARLKVKEGTSEFRD